MKRWFTLVGAALALLCAGFFAWTLMRNWESISESLEAHIPWHALGTATFLYVATFVPVVCAWFCIVRALGGQVRFAALTKVHLLAQFAKYLPSNLGHHIGRVLLARRLGLGTELILISIALDILILVLAAAICATPALSVLSELIRAYEIPHTNIVVISLIVSLVVGGFYLANRVARPFLRQQIEHLRRVSTRPGMKLIAISLTAHAFNFVLGAAALYSLLLAFSAAGATIDSAVTVFGVYSAAWLAGFVVPGAPAGLGIREAALVLGLSPFWIQADVITAAASFRLVTTAGDGVAFIIGTLVSSGDAVSA